MVLIYWGAVAGMRIYLEYSDDSGRDNLAFCFAILFMHRLENISFRLKSTKRICLQEHLRWNKLIFFNESGSTRKTLNETR